MSNIPFFIPSISKFILMFKIYAVSFGQPPEKGQHGTAPGLKQRSLSLSLVLITQRKERKKES